jgi:hypothetical protein
LALPLIYTTSIDLEGDGLSAIDPLVFRDAVSFAGCHAPVSPGLRLGFEGGGQTPEEWDDVPWITERNLLS